MATATQKFGGRIKQLRKNLGLSQEKLAEMARLDYSYLNMIEAGKKNPSLKRILKLSRALKVTLHEMFSFDK